MLHGATALQNSLTQKFCSYVDAQKKWKHAHTKTCN
jgi:hypothetical protein